MYSGHNEIPGGGQAGQVLTYSRGAQWSNAPGSPSYVYADSGLFSYTTSFVGITWTDATYSNAGGWTEAGQDLISNITATLKLFIDHFVILASGAPTWIILLNTVEIAKYTAPSVPTFSNVHLATHISVVPTDVIRVEYKRNSNDAAQGRTLIALEIL